MTHIPSLKQHDAIPDLHSLAQSQPQMSFPQSFRISSPELIRFGLVGAVNTAIGISVILVGLALGLGDVTANLMGYAVGLTISFILNRRWTFRHKQRLNGITIGRYLLSFCIAYLVNLAIVLALIDVHAVARPVAHIVGAIVYTAIFYVSCRQYVFVSATTQASHSERKTTPLVGDNFAAFFIVAAALLYFFLKDIPLGHDQSWYFIAAHKILGGAKLYVDIVELNPPLAFYVMMPPVYLAGRLAVSPNQVFIAYVIGLASVSILWARHQLLRTPAVTAMYANSAAIVALVTTVALTAFDFGQRDVLMIILALPYLALSMRRLEGGTISRPHAVAIGLWAALGICLKPYFLIFPLATEILLYLNRRTVIGKWRPEVIAIGAACIAYAAIIVAVFPTYLTTMVPMANATYFAYGKSFPYTLICAEVFALPLIFGGYLVARQRIRLEARTDLLAVWVVAAFISYLTQNRGFTYHADPLRIMLIFLTASLFFRKRDKPGDMLLPRLAFLTGLLFIGIRIHALGLYNDHWATDLKERLARYGTHDGLYTFTAHVFIGFPLANRIDGPWVSRFPALWPIPGTERILAAPQDFSAERVAEARFAERYVTDAIVEDFQRHAPSIVIVDAREDKSYFGGVKFDYIADFKRDPRFARIWQHYRRVDNVSGFEIWRKISVDQSAFTTPH